MLQRLRGKELVYVISDFVCKSNAHFDDIGISHILVGAGAEKRGFRIKQRDVIFYEFHIQRVTLESMHQHHQMQGHPFFLTFT
jgi:hypothetical protein